MEVEKVRDVLKQIKDIRPAIQLSDIGIITPYSKQVAKIKTMLQIDGYDANAIAVGSVEQFQGEEKRVIIISTVRAAFEHVASDIKYKLGFLSDRKRFNVAVTRAKELLVVVGHPRLLFADPCWRALLQLCSEKGAHAGSPIPTGTEGTDNLLILQRHLAHLVSVPGSDLQYDDDGLHLADGASQQIQIASGGVSREE